MAAVTPSPQSQGLDERRERGGQLSGPVMPVPSTSPLRRVVERGGGPGWREKIWPGPAMKLVGPLAARSPGLRLALALERNCSADEILQGRLIDLVAFVDVDGAPGIPVEAG